MDPLHIQRLLAFVFISLGSWALLFPSHVLEIGIRPEFNTEAPVTTVIMGCFGAQAVLGGLVMALSRFTAQTFLVVGIVGSLPFFVFNYYFVFVVEMFTNWMLLDFVGNIAIFALCMLGYLGLKKRGTHTT
ncbi:MAG: hypothetical protein AAF346_08005 [Pseudomonadota bacterium]